MENIEISGTQGKFLTANARQLYLEFQSVSDRFRSLDYNIIDVEVKRFEDEYYEFRTVVKELERRLVAVISRAFDDCSTLLAAFKLLQSFESLMSRDAVAADLEKKNTALLESYAADLRVVQVKNQPRNRYLQIYIFVHSIRQSRGDQSCSLFGKKKHEH